MKLARSTFGVVRPVVRPAWTAQHVSLRPPTDGWVNTGMRAMTLSCRELWDRKAVTSG